jgi:hypothetical protein
MNYKRKSKKITKLYRNGIDGIGCPYCGSNWLYSKYFKKHIIQWENESWYFK